MIPYAPMTIWFDLKKWLKQSIAPALCLAAAAYFGYHAFQGDHGVFAMGRLEAEIELARLELAKSEAKRRHLENRVRLVRPNAVDADLLDELARRQLGMTHPDEIVIYFEAEE